MVFFKFKGSKIVTKDMESRPVTLHNTAPPQKKFKKVILAK